MIFNFLVLDKSGRSDERDGVNRMSVIEVLPICGTSATIQIVRFFFYFVGEIGIIWGFRHRSNKFTEYKTPTYMHNTHCDTLFIC